jgi:hypothetical protein
MSRESPSCGRDSPPRPGLGAVTKSLTCLARALGSFTASDEGCLRSHDRFDVWKVDGHSGSARPVELTRRRGGALVLRRAFTGSAGAPRGRECREAWTCERRSVREPCEDRDAPGWLAPAEARSGSGRDARAGWRVAPLGALDERRRAGRRSCAAAQTDGPCRGDPHTTRCKDRRGENALAEPLPRPRTFPPRRPRRDPLALAGDRSPGGRQWPPPRRALTGSDAPGGPSILSFTLPPRARAAHRLSLAGPPSPLG